MQGSFQRFETKLRRDAAVNIDKQRTIIAPILRLVFSLTSLVDTSDFFEVSPYSSWKLFLSHVLFCYFYTVEF